MAGLYAPLPTLRRRPRGPPAHGSGATWIATPSSQWTFTTYSLPVSRRTHSRCGLHTRAVTVFRDRYPKASAISSPPCLLRLLPAGAKRRVGLAPTGKAPPCHGARGNRTLGSCSCKPFISRSLPLRGQRPSAAGILFRRYRSIGRFSDGFRSGDYKHPVRDANLRRHTVIVR